MDTKRRVESEFNLALIDEICTRIKRNKRVQRALPGDGFLRIDRQLPFLCVYRRPANKEDPLTSRLVISEAAYIIIPAGRYRAKYQLLLKRIIEVLSHSFGSFLLFQLWAGTEVREDESVEPEAVRPEFEIFADTSGGLISTCDVLESGLKKIQILKKKARTAITYSRTTHPPDMPPILSRSQMSALNCDTLGLAVQPIYRNLETDEAFPLVFRGLHRGLSHALRQAFFEFTRSNTRTRPLHYHALGPRSINKSVLEVDHKLAAIGSAYDFLLLASPINTQACWQDFKKSGFGKAPLFHYRPLPVDPAELKKELYSINLNRVADPTLSYMFRQKRSELDRELTMLYDRGTDDFLLSSLQLYGRVEAPLVRTALEIIDSFPGRSRDETFTGRHSAADFARRAQAEIDKFRSVCGEAATSRVIITDEVSGLICSQGNMLVGSSVHVPNNRVEALIQHEIGTHILTRINGRQQPFQLLAGGLNGYDEIQEGLAVLAEYLVGQLNIARLRLLAGRVIAAHHICGGATFIDTFQLLVDEYGFEAFTAFRITARIYRGGGLVKDAIYLRGLIRLLNYLADDGDLNLLFTGKFALEHIPIIRELLHRKVLVPPVLQPTYMTSKAALKRLNHLRQGLSPIDLISTQRKRDRI